MSISDTKAAVKATRFTNNTDRARRGTADDPKRPLSRGSTLTPIIVALDLDERLERDLPSLLGGLAAAVVVERPDSGDRVSAKVVLTPDRNPTTQEGAVLSPFLANVLRPARAPVAGSGAASRPVSLPSEFVVSGVSVPVERIMREVAAISAAKTSREKARMKLRRELTSLARGPRGRVGPAFEDRVLAAAIAEVVLRSGTGSVQIRAAALALEIRAVCESFGLTTPAAVKTPFGLSEVLPRIAMVLDRYYSISMLPKRPSPLDPLFLAYSATA